MQTVGLVCVLVSALIAGSQCQCVSNGVTYQVGESYNPSPCTYCTCTSSGMPSCLIADCAYPLCLDGSTPQTPPGACCPVCNSVA